MARPYPDKFPEYDLPEVGNLLFGHDRFSDGIPNPKVYEILSGPFGQLPRLAAYARASAEHRGISYRGFRVGAAGFVTDPENRRAAILLGANFTPFPGAPRRCAEMELLEKAYRGGYKRVESIAVSGPLQADSESGVLSDTLHPCSECRRLFRNHPLIYPDTMLMTVDDTGEAHEVYDMREFFRLHGASYFDDREDLYADDFTLQEAIAKGWGEEPRQQTLFKKAAGLVLQKARNLRPRPPR